MAAGRKPGKAGRTARPQTEAGTDATAARRAAILDAAGAVFLTRGYAAATTLEIATRARTSKRALYDLFGPKEAILAALIRDTSARMQAPLDLPPPETRAAFFATLDAFGRAFLAEFVHPHRIAVYRLAIGEAVRSAEIGAALEAGGRGPVVAAATRLFAAGIARGFVADVGIDLMIAVFFGVLVGPLQMSLLLGTVGTPDAAAIAARARTATQAIERLAGGG